MMMSMRMRSYLVPELILLTASSPSSLTMSEKSPSD